MDTEIFRVHPLLGTLSNVPILIGALAMLLVLSRKFRNLLGRHPVPLIGAAFVATRLVFLVLIVGFLGHVSTDMRVFFQGSGAAILDGQLPYRDFESWYAPLFPFLMAIPALAGQGAWPFFLFFIVCDLLALWIVWQSACPDTGAGNGTHAEPERETATRAAWLYTVAPVTWYFLVRFGQDEALMAAFLAVAFALQRSRRETAAAVLLGLAFAATKFTFLIFIVPFWIASRGRLRFFLASFAAAALAFVPFLVLGAPVWQPVVEAGEWLDYGPSLWRLPFFFLGQAPGWPVTLPLVIVLAGIWIVAFRRQERDLVPLLLLSGLVFLILSPRVMPFYIVPLWPFASLWLAGAGRRYDIALAAALNLLLGVWWYLDTGGMQGRYGPVSFALALAVTALVPLLTAVWAWRVLRSGRARFIRLPGAEGPSSPPSPTTPIQSRREIASAEWILPR